MTRREISCCASDYAEEFFYHHIQKHLHDHQIAKKKKELLFSTCLKLYDAIGTNKKLMKATARVRKKWCSSNAMNVKISGEQSKRAMLTKHVHVYCFNDHLPLSTLDKTAKNWQRSQKKLSVYPCIF